MSLMRVWSDIHMIELLFHGSNNEIQANCKFYTTDKQIYKISKSLCDWFPRSGDETLFLEFGSKEASRMGYVILKLRTVDKRGHIVVQVEVSNNCEGNDYMFAKFNIKSDIPSINRFGKDMEQLILEDGNIIKLCE